MKKSKLMHYAQSLRPWNDLVSGPSAVFGGETRRLLVTWRSA